MIDEFTMFQDFPESPDMETFSLTYLLYGSCVHLEITMSLDDNTNYFILHRVTNVCYLKPPSYYTHFRVKRENGHNWYSSLH